MTLTTAKWSIADYHHMIETGLLVDRSVELLNGEIIEMTPERETPRLLQPRFSQIFRAAIRRAS